jgi:phage shock protein PspC (stress-responsive transcriptional regulator)
VPPRGPEHAAEPAPEAATVVTPPAPARRLTRSREDRVLAGVCGGLGEYFGVDAVLIRIAALVLVFAGGAGILLYAIGWIAMPEAPEAGTPEAESAAAAAPARERTGGGAALGLLFVLLGAAFLVDEIWSDFLSWTYVWPIALIVVGAAVLVRARQ